jgi:hypothetical protein
VEMGQKGKMVLRKRAFKDFLSGQHKCTGMNYLIFLAWLPIYDRWQQCYFLWKVKINDLISLRYKPIQTIYFSFPF